MNIRLIRHATLQIELAGQQILIDPMLAESNTYRSLTFGTSAAKNPMTSLPCAVETLLQPDIILATHFHFDHFDSAAINRLPKQIPLVCQPADQDQFNKYSYSQLIPVTSSPVSVKNLQIYRTDGKHGKGLLGKAMGHVSGFILKADQEPVIYIAGDTIWGPAVQDAIQQHQPDIIVLNAGAAQFNIGAPITMTAEDVLEVCRAAPQAKIVAVHMEAINHCRLRRLELSNHIAKVNLSNQVFIPADGELIIL